MGRKQIGNSVGIVDCSYLFREAGKIFTNETSRYRRQKKSPYLCASVVNYTTRPHYALSFPVHPNLVRRVEK